MSKDLSEPITVIIADDHVLYRAGVKTALSAKKDIKVVAEADNGMHLLNLIKSILLFGLPAIMLFVSYHFFQNIFFRHTPNCLLYNEVQRQNIKNAEQDLLRIPVWAEFTKEEQDMVNQSSDLADTILNSPDQLTELEKAVSNKTVDKLDAELLEDLKC